MQKAKIIFLLALLQYFCVFSQEIDTLDTDGYSVHILETPPPHYILPFHSLDSIAHTIKYTGNLEKTTYELTKNYTSQTEKARAIFAWVTYNIAYDYKSYNKQKDPKFPKCKGHDDCAQKMLEWENDYLDKILRNKKAVCEGYSRLFKRMCGHAGIQCSVVPGYVKRSSRAIGRMGSLNHAWNIVILDGKSYYLDATWAAGFCTLDEKKGKLDGYQRWYNDFYWLMPQEKFRLNHFPKDTIWPFTSKADKIKYRDQPYINSHFISSLDVLSPETGVLKVKMCDKIKFRLHLEYAIGKIQINTNVFKNPKIDWYFNEEGERVADKRILGRQKYVDYVGKDQIYEFEYEVKNTNLRYIEVLFDYETALKFKVEVQKPELSALP
ncbi:hypothetical protein HUK80_08445 [Flavobacterium sp. MAH-1]|nr:transglutaminase domain-containing protein [Flavobacterium agri]NUY80920.1 hypothetical protein [Flavobacterium agri]